MKKIVSVVLSTLLLLSCLPVAVNAAEDPLVVSVANDLHYNPESATEPVTKHNNLNADFYHAGHGGQMPEESVALIHAYLALAAQDESDVLLLPGDLVNDGTVEQHTELAAIFTAFEEACGKQIYVVPGNHDLYETTIDEFSTIYTAFGYGDAIARDTATASYVVDLNSEYRLIAIDSTDPGQSPHGMTNERAEWIRQQCVKAREDGKKLIAMMHHNAVEHFIFAKKLHSTAIVEGDVALAEILATNGVKYLFTGHTHDQDIAQYTAADGSVLYDVVTGSMFCYPCPYRIVTFGSDVKFEARKVTSVDTTLLPRGITDVALNLAATDMTAYSKICTWIGMRSTITSYTKTSSVLKLMDLDKENDVQMYDLMTRVLDKANEVILWPVYAKDAADSEMSIEAYLGQYDIAIPTSDYADLVDVAVEIYQAEVVGDENFRGHSPEVLLVTRGLAAVLHYALADVTPTEYAAVLSFITDLLGYEINEDFLLYTADAVSRMKGLELILMTAVMPLVCEFTIDDAPADNNTTLPGYGSDSVKEEKNIFEQIYDFFMKIYNALMTFFAHFFG